MRTNKILADAGMGFTDDLHCLEHEDCVLVNRIMADLKERLQTHNVTEAKMEVLLDKDHHMAHVQIFLLDDDTHSDCLVDSHVKGSATFDIRGGKVDVKTVKVVHYDLFQNESPQGDRYELLDGQIQELQDLLESLNLLENVLVYLS